MATPQGECRRGTVSSRSGSSSWSPWTDKDEAWTTLGARAATLACSNRCVAGTLLRASTGSTAPVRVNARLARDAGPCC